MPEVTKNNIAQALKVDAVLAGIIDTGAPSQDEAAQMAKVPGVKF